MNAAIEMTELLSHLTESGESFAVATVVRTVSVTSAKPGAKAIINGQGQIVNGWVGGGCAKRAVVKAAQAAIEDGQPRFLSIQPKDLLAEQGLEAGAVEDGRLMAGNMCPSKGSMDVFVEPVLANPELIIIGNSPVAKALIKLTAGSGFSVSVPQTTLDLHPDIEPQQVYEKLDNVALKHPHRYVVIATQGSGDMDALLLAASWQARHIAFVGSRRKMTFLAAKLSQQGLESSAVERVKAPAGLDLGAITPIEIALSILAELVQLRRGGGSSPDNS